jgi:Ca2+-binding EF-hand superfamily protein
MESLANVAAWTTCPHCNSKLSAAAFAKHEARCKMRADVQAERDGLLALQKLEGAKPKPQPSWPQCTNCGERYGPLQLLAHTKRCTKLLPHGANGFGPQDHARNPQFARLYTKAAKIVAPRGGKPSAPPSLADTVNSSLKNWGKSMGDLLSALGPKIDKDTLERLRKLFDRFDVNHDKLLSIDEFGVLMRNCFPTRVADANQIVAEFRTFDVDGSGSIDFDEFTRRYLQMRQAVDPRYDEACAMFDFFDADGSGTLDPDEFLCLLNQVPSSFASPVHSVASSSWCRASHPSLTLPPPPALDSHPHLSPPSPLATPGGRSSLTIATRTRSVQSPPSPRPTPTALAASPSRSSSPTLTCCAACTTTTTTRTRPRPRPP